MSEATNDLKAVNEVLRATITDVTAENTRLRDELMKRDVVIGQMSRQSESERVARDAIHLVNHQSELRAQTDQMQQHAKVQQHEADVRALKELLAPTALTMLKKLTDELTKRVTTVPPAPASRTSADFARDAFDASRQPVAARATATIVELIEAAVSKADVEAFKTTLGQVVAKLSPDGLAYLRAYLCSELIPNAPSSPDVMQQLAAFVMKDVDESTLKSLFDACTKAYVSTSAATVT